MYEIVFNVSNNYEMIILISSFCATENWFLNLVIETLTSFYVSTTISMLLTLLCRLFSLETASLATLGGLHEM